jgi:hypothetical protein
VTAQHGGDGVSLEDAGGREIGLRGSNVSVEAQLDIEVRINEYLHIGFL